MRKSPDAFRTISEVAQELDLPQHVLRFWETRFSQIKPMKRGGGRRYYRPDDVELLRGIRHLLYGEGYTIKGVQRILKEQGVRHVIEAFPGHVPQAEGAGDQGEMGVGDTQMDSQPSPAAPAAQPEGVPTIAQPNQPFDINNGQTAPHHPAPTQPMAAQLEPQPTQQGVIPANQAPLTPSVSEQTLAPAAMAQEVSPPEPQATVPQAAQISTTASAAQQAMEPSQSVAQPMPNALPSQPDLPQAAEGTPGISSAPMPAPMAAPPVVEAPQQPFVPAPVVNSVAPAPGMPAQPTHPQVQGPQAAPLPLGPNILIPHVTQPTPIPPDLSPVYQQGQETAVSIEVAQNNLVQENKSGFFSRLRGKAGGADGADMPAQAGEGGMPRDDVRRLQSTLFELLECKRILDQARSSS